MRLSRRSFFKALGGGVVAALLPGRMLAGAEPVRTASQIDDYLTHETIWMLPEDARAYNEMIAKDSRADCEEGIY